jgi:hypothetical protein
VPVYMYFVKCWVSSRAWHCMAGLLCGGRTAVRPGAAASASVCAAHCLSQEAQSLSVCQFASVAFLKQHPPIRATSPMPLHAAAHTRHLLQADGLPQPDLVHTLPGPPVTNSRHWM